MLVHGGLARGQEVTNIQKNLKFGRNSDDDYWDRIGEGESRTDTPIPKRGFFKALTQ